jgi:hypothetical protein
MTAGLIQGDQVSCSRTGGTMRRQSARLREQATLLADALADLAVRDLPDLPDVAGLVRAMHATADDLDQAGAALQRYATGLAQAHELGRRAEARVQAAGLLLEATRVVEPWGPASAQEAERRRAEVPEIQSRVDLATAHIGRARGRLEREMTRLARRFSDPARQTHPARQTAPPSRGS